MQIVKIIFTSYCLLIFFLLGNICVAQEAADQEISPENRGVLLEQYQQLEKEDAANSSNPDLQRQYLDTVIALGYYDLAAHYYEKKLADTPEDKTLLRELGDAWMKVGPYGYEKSFEALKRALSLEPENISTLASLAELCHKTGLYNEAEGYYDQTLQLDPNNVPARLGKAVFQVRSGDIAGASRIFDEVGVEAQPYDVTTRLMLRKALFVFEHNGGWFDDTAKNHADYARLLYRAGRISDAVLAARRAVTINADDYATWNFIAAMQLQIGNLEFAEKAYGQSLDANPDQPDIAKQRRQLINEITSRQQKTSP